MRMFTTAAGSRFARKEREARGRFWARDAAESKKLCCT
jgi:hypothetical protein